MLAFESKPCALQARKNVSALDKYLAAMRKCEGDKPLLLIATYQSSPEIEVRSRVPRAQAGKRSRRNAACRKRSAS